MYVNNMKKLIEKQMNEIIKELTLKFSTKAKKVFLNHKVKIDVKDTPEKQTIAFYENTFLEEKDYTHIINITPMFISLCACWIDTKNRKQAIKQINETLKHELIHAFVFEEFETLDIITNMHSDYSPIFLSCLYWGGACSSHSHVDKFILSDLAKKTIECKDYEELKDLLLDYIFEYERSLQIINNNIGPKKKLSIIFNFRGAGIKKEFYLKIDQRSKESKSISNSTFEQLILGIGFLVTPSSLLYEYKYKFENMSVAGTHKETVIYCLSSKKNKEVEVFSNF